MYHTKELHSALFCFLYMATQMSPGQYNVRKQDIIAKVLIQNYIPVTASNIKDKAELSHHSFVIISHAQFQLLTLPSFDLAKIFLKRDCSLSLCQNLNPNRHEGVQCCISLGQKTC